MTRSAPALDDRRIEALMDGALALAERGGGGTAPNPMVGCVLCDADGQILGEGFHARAGEAHAEVLALEDARAAGHDVHGATAVVTLEPCAHPGKTPPCAETMARAGIGRVVYAMADPHVGRGGAVHLEAAGIPVRGGVRERMARRLNEPWLHFIATGRPFFHLKTAQTLNARVTRGREDERWVTGVAARAAVHRLRRRHAAVLVGIGTVQADDPLLTVREWPPAGSERTGDPPWPDVQPVRVILDSRLGIPLSSRLIESARSIPVWIFCGSETSEERSAELAARGAEIVRVPHLPAGLDLEAVSHELVSRGVTGVLVEPGPTLATAFLESGFVDRWTMFLAPDWVAARGALPLLLSEAPHTGFVLDEAEWEVHDSDAAVSGRVRRATPR
ncbi:MAG TPA: bifunctional diaminohydroxyphosphoribosylaminopyrimidine deaminase/5-amino-6-(5-phosphoribosylamino)uracil reductase RibD [Gemmatimonadota bacterium]|nr:bifunctional diaminohydroxyphosphoribosylaminopyrimidine deaminase/5-amino-6-(5-phosphoribosylamino)uracil reductase RibD [Gemmatimonadota bacterium]